MVDIVKNDGKFSAQRVIDRRLRMNLKQPMQVHRANANAVAK